MKKILFGVSGIGNGHANRETPIIEELAKENRIMIFAHDDSLTVLTDRFGDNKNVTLVPVGLTFVVGSPTGLDFGATAHLRQNQDIESFRKSFEALDKIVRDWGKADLVVTDYEPISAQYAYAYKVPLVTSDQQSKFLFGDFPVTLGGFTYEDEVKRLSMFFPKADKRIACSFFRVAPKKGADDILVVPSTIREAVRSLRKNRAGKELDILVYISSARDFVQTPEEIVEVLENQEAVFHMFVPPKEIERYKKVSPANCRIYQHGDPRFLTIMAGARGIISTAGHSLLSEAMYLGIPVYAVPVAPYEQHLNAWAISENNFGVSETKITKEKLSEFIDNLERFEKNIQEDESVLLRGNGQEEIVNYLKKNFLTDKKKILVFSPPFSGHLNILKEMIRDNQKDFDFRLIINGWKNIKPDLTGVEEFKTEIIERRDLAETDPALWTFPRVADQLESCLTIAEEFKPDLIIYDFFSVEGYLAGKKLNIPYWCSVPAMIGPFDNQDYRDRKFSDPINVEALKEIQERFGVKISADEVEMVSDGFLVPGLVNLVWSFSQLTLPDFRRGRADKPYVFVGNLRGDNFEKTNFKNPKPLVYFSFGTVVMNNLWNQQEETRENLKRFFGELAKIWGEKNYQIIFVTQGKSVLEKYPENWWVYDSVDQVEILSRADLFVTHGGSNSFHEAVMQKVPMAVIPFFGDQLLVAKRIEELGFGEKVGGSQDIDTHGSKEFINPELAKKLDAFVEKILTSKEYAKKYLSLELEAINIQPLIKGEVEIKGGEVVLGRDGQIKSSTLPKKLVESYKFFLENIEDKREKTDKGVDFFASVSRVHIPLQENEGPKYFQDGVFNYERVANTWIPIKTNSKTKKDKVEKIFENVVVTSESPIKIAAVEKAMAVSQPKKYSVKGINPHLAHDEQLVGIDEIVKAAIERLEAVAREIRGADLYVSIVSGLTMENYQYFDRAVVVLMDKEGNKSIAKSAGLALPLNETQRAKVRGYKKFTVGKIMAEDLAEHKYETDPHMLITQGKQKREEFLTEAILAALKKL